MTAQEFVEHANWSGWLQGITCDDLVNNATLFLRAKTVSEKWITTQFYARAYITSQERRINSFRATLDELKKVKEDQAKLSMRVCLSRTFLGGHRVGIAGHRGRFRFTDVKLYEARRRPRAA